MPDTFLGAWLVSEYIYNPDGRFAGIVRQRRELTQLANGRIRVTQHCTPDAALQTQAMGQFSGEWVFELSVDGRFRRYHGPDVIGSGTTWGEGVLTGHGLWPRFRHNFRSFAALPTPQQQLTGGQFFQASEMVANIVGIAVPETAANEYPDFAGSVWANELTPAWHGRYRLVSASGEVRQETAVERRYSENGRWRDVSGDGQSSFWQLQPQALALCAINEAVSDPLLGLSKQVGWMLEAELVNKTGQMVAIREVVNGRAGHLVSLRHWWQDGILNHVEILLLQA